MTILGISLGTARTGVCVLKDEVLIDKQMHEFNDTWSDSKLRIIINCYKRYILKHNVTAIIVKIPPLDKIKKPLSLMMKHLEKLAKKQHCEFDLTTKFELKHRIGVRSTKELIAYTTLLYPELSTMFDKGVKNEHSYYKKLFEAIIAAYIYQERQQVRAQQLANTIK
jgi:RNase H-fold protein (predicted Holliday junction resolvase)